MAGAPWRAERSCRHGGTELVDESGEPFGGGGVVVVGMLADEVDHLAIAVGRLAAVAARLVHHSEPVPAVVHVGEADQQVACGRLGLVEPCGADKVPRQNRVGLALSKKSRLGRCGYWSRLRICARHTC